jgi:CheY-like chemotaxis protein
MAIQRSLEGWRVLVIEDDFDSQMVAAMLLKAAGAEVTIAENGQVGLEKLRQIKPYFVLCDISMPVMDGWQLMAAVQQEDALRQIPIIALTAHAMVGDREKALAAGFVNYITKPLHAGKFMTELIAILTDLPDFAGQLTEEPKP